MNTKNGKQVVVKLPDTSNGSVIFEPQISKPVEDKILKPSPEKLMETDESQIVPVQVELDQSATFDDTSDSYYRNLGIDKYSGEFVPIENTDVMRRKAMDAIAMSDHAEICAVLNAYVTSEQTITSQELSKWLGDSAPKDDGDTYDCFEFIWFGYAGKKRRVNRTWQVKLYNPIKARAEKQLKRERQKTVKAKKNSAFDALE